MGGSNKQLMEALYLELADTHIVPKPVSENKIQADNKTKYQKLNYIPGQMHYRHL